MTTLLDEFTSWNAQQHTTYTIGYGFEHLLDEFGPDQTGPYLVVRSRSHGGGTISKHQTALAAIKAAHRQAFDDCSCGCAGVVPVGEYDNLGSYENCYSPYALCR